jgi:hypothetical protein
MKRRLIIPPPPWWLVPAIVAGVIIYGMLNGTDAAHF